MFPCRTQVEMVTEVTRICMGSVTNLDVLETAFYLQSYLLCWHHGIFLCWKPTDKTLI